MPETIRYTRLGKEDLNLGTGTFEARLADGKVVVLSQIDIAAILSDPTLSSRSVTLDSLTVTTFTPITITPPTNFQVPEKTDPVTPLSGEIWINSAGTFLEYAGDEGTPTKHQVVGHDTTQTMTNKTLTAPAISGPTLSGTVLGTYTLGGTPTLGASLSFGGNNLTNIDEIELTDASANPTAAGRLRRQGNQLGWRTSTGSMRVFYGEAGTVMLFQQSSAPTGWTKITTQHDKVLRVVSGAAGSGGTRLLSAGITESHVLTAAEIPALGINVDNVDTGNGSTVTRGAANDGTITAVNTVGSGGGHTHTLDLAYVDLILASKD